MVGGLLLLSSIFILVSLYFEGWHNFAEFSKSQVYQNAEKNFIFRQFSVSVIIFSAFWHIRDLKNSAKAMFSQKTIWLNQQNFGYFNHRIYLFYGQQNIDPTKYLVKSTKFFGCYNQIGIFSKFNKELYFNQQKFVWFNHIFLDIQQNTSLCSRKLIFCVPTKTSPKTESLNIYQSLYTSNSRIRCNFPEEQADSLESFPSGFLSLESLAQQFFSTLWDKKGYLAGMGYHADDDQLWSKRRTSYEKGMR